MPKLTRIDGMLRELCLGYGWCGSIVDGESRHVTDFMPTSGVVTADEFVSWLLKADGVDPNQASSQVDKWKRDLRAVFVKHMGSDKVDASELQRQG